MSPFMDRVMSATLTKELYTRLIEAWNLRDAQLFAEQFADACTCIGFDGSEMHGKSDIDSQLSKIFKDHVTARYIMLIREVKEIQTDVCLLRAHVGMIPNGTRNVDPGKNAVQVAVAQFQNGVGKIIHFQNTPAQYHGRPDVQQGLTKELQRVADEERALQ